MIVRFIGSIAGLVGTLLAGMVIGCPSSWRPALASIAMVLAAVSALQARRTS